MDYCKSIFRNRGWSLERFINMNNIKESKSEDIDYKYRHTINNHDCICDCRHRREQAQYEKG